MHLEMQEFRLDFAYLNFAQPAQQLRQLASTFPSFSGTFSFVFSSGNWEFGDAYYYSLGFAFK